MLLNFDDIRPNIGRPGGVRLAPTPTMPNAGPGMGMEPMLQGTNEAMLGPTPGFNPETTQPPAPQGAPATGGLFDRIKARLGAVGEKLLPVDPNVAGMLTPEQIKAARQRALMRASATMLELSGPRPRDQRVSLGQGLGRALLAAQGGFEQDVGGMAGIANSLKQQQALEAQAQARAAVKAQVMAQFPVDPNATPEEQQAAVQQQYRALVNAGLGDEPETKSLAMTLQGGAFRPPAAPEPIQVDAGDRIEFLDPGTLQTIRSVPKPKPAPAPKTDSPMTTAQLIAREDRLQKDFQQQTAKYETVSNMIGVMNGIKEAALAGQAPAQIAMLTSFMRLTDPASAVRPSEFETAENAGGLFRKAKNILAKVQKGTPVEASVMQEFYDTVAQMEQQWGGEFRRKYDQFEMRAKKGNLDPANIVIDYFPNFQRPNRISNFAKPPQ